MMFHFVIQHRARGWWPAALALLAAAPVLAQELRVIPYPRSIRTSGPGLTLPSPVSIAVVSREADDQFAAGLLRDEIRDVHGKRATIGSHGLAAPRIVLRRAETGGPESYRIRVEGKEAIVEASAAPGMYYGVQTLRQLLSAAPNGVRLPGLHIEDAPAMRHRGVSIDISQGPTPTEESMREIIRTCAEYKMNVVSFYMQHNFAYSHAPLAAHDGARVTPEQMKRLVTFALRHHVVLIPQQQTLGHMHNLLRLERYQALADAPHGQSLLAGAPQTLDWMARAGKELAAVFPGPFLHIGGDEAWDLGKGVHRERVEKEGYWEVYADHVRKTAEALRPTGKQILFWTNHLNAVAADKLPKEFIAVAWQYSPEKDFSPRYAPFVKAGMRFWVAPGVNNWRRIFPNVTEALGNINSFTAEGKRKGAEGMLNTVWFDHGEELLPLSWYPLVFSAAAAWEERSVDVARFDRSFDWAFYRAGGDTFIKAIRALDSTHQMFAATGAGVWRDQISHEIFWIDPFSRRGAAMVRKALPAAAEIRLAAENALVDLEAAGASARLHAGTVPFLKHAARRLDVLGMRIQFAAEIADFYRKLSAKDAYPRFHRFHAIRHRIRNIIDSMDEVKREYARLYSSFNTVFRLGSILTKYDAEMLRWEARQAMFEEIRAEAPTEKQMPTPESVGLHLP